jgi:PPOX class probable F420-dependent enzyme
MLDAKALSFLEANTAAAMITLRRDGAPHATRVGIAVIDGKIWSSGTQTRLRTKHLRRDPRSTLFVFEGGGMRYLSLESEVTILDSPDAPQLSVRLFQEMQKRMPTQPPEGKLMWFGQLLTIQDFRAKMVEEQRLIYEFNVKRAYGMY